MSSTTLNNITTTEFNTSYINKSSQSWFVPRIFNSFTKAVEQQAKDAIPDRNATLSFGYLVSPYAGACMTMAIILNRTVVFASSRRNINRLSTVPKIALRIISMAVLIKALWDIFMQFTVITPDVRRFVGAFVSGEAPEVNIFLWRIFISLCISQFIETFVSITSNQSALNDTGLTLFEHSLAFQECQFLSIPSSQLLFICLFSIINQLVIHTLGIANLKKYQLIPSTVLGVSFLIFYCYNIYTGGLVFFPTVVIVSIIPQFLVFSIIFLCLLIYFLAVLVNQDSSGLTYTTMVRNLKSSINLQLNDDFHSALMRFGYIMFNAVEKEEYVNELSNLTLPSTTYLESNGHLVSGYLNNVQSNPELSSQQSQKVVDDDEFKNSNFARRMVNCAKLMGGIVRLVFKKKKKPTNDLPASISDQPAKAFSNYEINSDITPSDYKLFLSNDSKSLLPENDSSEDFVYESESDIDPLDFESDIEDIDEIESPGYLSSAAMARLYDSGNLAQSIATESPTKQRSHSKAIDELIGSNDLLELITPKNIEQVSFLNSLRTHMIEDKRLTRSSYSEINQDELLREVILENRADHHNHSHHEEPQELACVVCQTNNREIIVWPCKCFALCENCRISLGVRGFSICVCCRRKVDGYSKIYIP
ncbi:unnamed protein product [Wickerhamomyces anomalus]